MDFVAGVPEDLATRPQRVQPGVRAFLRTRTERESTVDRTRSSIGRADAPPRRMDGDAAGIRTRVPFIPANKGFQSTDLAWKTRRVFASRRQRQSGEFLADRVRRPRPERRNVIGASAGSTQTHHRHRRDFRSDYQSRKT